LDAQMRNDVGAPAPRRGRRSRVGDVIVGAASALAVLAVIWGAVLVRQGHHDVAAGSDSSTGTAPAPAQ
jgi:hypothetical protein